MDNRVYYGEYSLKHWIDLILKENIILPEYQRYFVWDEKKVETLIDTFRKKQFVPPVTIGAFKNGDASQNLILDGQQRLTSVLLAFLGLYPDQATYKKAIEKFANENDDEEEESEQIDNILEWTFESLIQKGKNKESILEKIVEGNYKKIDLSIDNDFLESTFLGFSYLVPYISDENEQQKYYSSVFRNINIQGQILLPQESRSSLYFLDKDLIEFFEPEFCKNIVVKSVSSETKTDFVRYLSLLSQYNKDKSANYVARSYKPQMEKYYEEYVYSAIADIDSKYGKFSDNFPSKNYKTQFLSLQKHLTSLDIPKQFSSIIDLDMYLCGLIFKIVFENKTIDETQKSALKQELEGKITEFKANASHTKAPSNLGHLRSRIATSIEIYENYAP
jgi:bifunctional DNA-binding transcriptional regulator/antitoxin component of YhaV-PrlF toxin-antitoxin module